jgi:hypothetical protein
MIHRSARDMVCEQFGTAAWERIMDAAGLDESVLIGARSYPDDITFKLIAAAADISGQSLEDTLLAFGRYWVRSADQGPYAGTLSMLGTSLLGALKNLDSMHAGILMALPEARLPQFRVISENASEIRVAYYSHRQGLEAFVRGLLEGLLERYATAGVVTLAGHEDAPVFAITLT